MMKFVLYGIVASLVVGGYMYEKNHQEARVVATVPAAQFIVLQTESGTTTLPVAESGTVLRAVDGDTIEVSLCQDVGVCRTDTVRYIGVNTPETVDKRKAVQCFGKEASSVNKKLVVGESVLLVKDVSDRDKYGRLLRYVFLSKDKTFVNLYLVQNGYAEAATYPPDVALSKLFVAGAREAREGKRGLWGECRKK